MNLFYQINSTIFFFLVSLLTLEFASPIDPQGKKAKCKFKIKKVEVEFGNYNIEVSSNVQYI